MITKKELESLGVVNNIIKEFPDTGQKKVFLLEQIDGKKVIFKIVKSGDERVKREIEIVTQNLIPNVPKIMEVKGFTSQTGKSYICIVEEYIEGDTEKQLI